MDRATLASPPPVPTPRPAFHAHGAIPPAGLPVHPSLPSQLASQHLFSLAGFASSPHWQLPVLLVSTRLVGIGCAAYDPSGAMAGWASLEILKMTTSYLVSPLVFVWSVIPGYGSAADQRKLLASIQRHSVLIAAPPILTRSNTTVLDLSRDELYLLEDAQLDRPPDEPRPPSPSPSTHPTKPSATSNFSSPPSPTKFEEFALDEAAYEAALADRSLTSRPLSSILSHFSHRVTAHLSSFELVDQLSFDAAEDELFPPTRERTRAARGVAHPGREPTKAEAQFVARAMKVEVHAVEQILRHVIEQSMVAPVLEVQVEEGQSYFDSMRPSFVDVPVTKSGVDTEDFLQAVETLLKMFEQFSSTAFALVQGDIVENIRRIRVRCASNPFSSSTLEALVLGESTIRRKLATEALLWLVRGLKFTAMALRRNLSTPSDEELSASFTVAWDAEYSRYFNFLVRPFFKILVKACPTRAVFYAQLGNPREKVERDLDAWLSALEGLVGRLERFYVEGKHDKGF